MSFTRAELEAARNRSVPDLIGGGLRLLFVGINPGLWTAAAQAHFAKRGNRFYPALHLAGITEGVIDASDGLAPDDAAALIARGIGITNLVNRATARADELSVEEMRGAGVGLEKKVLAVEPRVVVVLGITAYRVAFDLPKATGGWQPDWIGTAQLLVAGNPSGLNAHQTVASLAASFRDAAIRAGVDLVRTPESSSGDQQTA